MKKMACGMCFLIGGGLIAAFILGACGLVNFTALAMSAFGLLGPALVFLGSTAQDSLLKESFHLPPRVKRLKSGKVYRLIELIPGAAIQGKGIVIIRDMDHKTMSYELGEEDETELAKAKGELFLLRPGKDGHHRLSPFGR